MREILPGVFMWGSDYVDKPWELNGYAIRLAEGTLLVDPPAPEQDNWSSLDALKPIKKIVLTNRDHVRDVEVFRARYGAGLIGGAHEVEQLGPLTVDETVREDDLVGGALRVIHLPGKSPGEIALYFEPDRHPVSRHLGGILLLGDAIIGHPPGALGLIPEHKLDDPAKLKLSLHKLLAFDFDVLLLCDGESVFTNAKRKLVEFLQNQSVD
jgi:glyoxylase-like metal-dependent hydrolase (beta-lactamase superfamily II)